MKAAFNFLLIPFLTLTLGISSCSKKCEVEAKDTNSGEIIDNVVIYPSSGSMTGNMGDDLVIDSTHKYANDFTISFNQEPKQSVDYNQYKILCCPVNVTCNVSFQRKVTIDHDLDKVTYELVATYCQDCWTKVYVENYVLVPTFPDFYQVEYLVEYNKI